MLVNPGATQGAPQGGVQTAAAGAAAGVAAGAAGAPEDVRMEGFTEATPNHRHG